MSAKKILRIKTICTNAPGCPCLTCGRVRLLLEHEGQRYAEDIDTRGIPTRAAVEHALEVTGQTEARRKHQAEVDALAQKFIDDYLNRQG